MTLLIIVLSILMFLFIWTMWEITEQEYFILDAQKLIQSCCDLISKQAVENYYLKRNSYDRIKYVHTKRISMDVIRRMSYLHGGPSSDLKDVLKDVEQDILRQMFQEISRDSQFKDFWSYTRDIDPISDTVTYKLLLFTEKQK